jgi:hypothetical protein
MFNGTSYLNQSIGFWDVSYVTNMKQMFYCAFTLNQDNSSWDVLNVTNMAAMFNGTSVPINTLNLGVYLA